MIAITHKQRQQRRQDLSYAFAYYGFLRNSPIVANLRLGMRGGAVYLSDRSAPLLKITPRGVVPLTDGPAVIPPYSSRSKSRSRSTAAARPFPFKHRSVNDARFVAPASPSSTIISRLAPAAFCSAYNSGPCPLFDAARSAGRRNFSPFIPTRSDQQRESAASNPRAATAQRREPRTGAQRRAWRAGLTVREPVLFALDVDEPPAF